MTIDKALTRRLAAYRYRLQRVNRRINWLAGCRLVLAIGILIGVISSFDPVYTAPGLSMALVASCIFLYLMVLHDRCYRFRDRFQLAIAMLEADLARAQWRFRDIPDENGIQFATEHPFAHDLDLSGPFSLLKLVNTCFHQRAHDTIKGWIEDASGVEEIRARQRAVEDLAPRRRFRQQLALACRLNSSVDLDPEMLRAWLAQPLPWTLRLPAYLLGRLTALATTTVIILHFFVGIELPWLATLIAQFGFFYLLDRAQRDFANEFLMRGKQIVAVCDALRTIEKVPVKADRLVALKAQLKADGTYAGRQLDRAIALHDKLGYRANGFAHVFLNLFFMWDQHFIRKLAQWRDAHGASLPGWVHLIFEFEALAALGNFKQLFPNHVFPELVEGDAIQIEAFGLGHPAIADSRRVGNDYRLTKNGQIHLVTGSNMSGKSTFLRTIGTNLVLARLGAPVCAQSLTCSLPRLWTSIRIQDSLEQGVSYFYAEVRRLKAILEAIEVDNGPVLYLMDEILRGTNSRERLIACKALVRFLLEHRASGLITTHDLEMLAIARERPDAITNYHFQERVEGDEMFFDYRLKDGELTSTNALRVMQGAGLPLVFEG